MPLSGFSKFASVVALSAFGFFCQPLLASDPGPLDQPLPNSDTKPGKPGAVTLVDQSVERASNPEAVIEQLRTEVAEEQEELEQLDREDLIEKAEDVIRTGGRKRCAE